MKEKGGVCAGKGEMRLVGVKQGLAEGMTRCLQRCQNGAWPLTRLRWPVLGCPGRITLLLRGLLSGSGILALFSASGFSSVKWDSWDSCLLWQSSPLGIKTTWTVFFGGTSRCVYVLERDDSLGLREVK